MNAWAVALGYRRADRLYRRGAPGELLIASFRSPPAEWVLDFDATDDYFVANPFRLLLSSLASREIAQK
jgi:hypothetical protein